MCAVLNELVVLNSPTGVDAELPAALNGLQWQTCLRRILMLNEAESPALVAAAAANCEIHRGKDAYHFLLEVVCGLRSPLVGETAVMGQFRDFCAKAKFPATSWGWFLRQLTADVLVDAKRVRHRHLQGLGSQSYGGLVRQHLKGIPAATVLGAGQLANEILPWLIGKTDVTLFYRNRLHAERLLDEYPQIRLNRFTMADTSRDLRETALVIAAPLAADEIENWIRLQRARFVTALDLRGTAELDPVRASFPVIRLSQLFAAVKNDRQKLTARVAAALAEINLAAERQAEQAQFRPFGWEDLCA